MVFVLGLVVIAVALILLGWTIGHFRRRDVGVKAAATPVSRDDR